MASSPKKDQEVQHPCFCVRIIDNDDLKDGRNVELPAKAVKKYGGQMGDHIFMKVPKCEEPWKVKLKRPACGNQMWLEEGWESFTSSYFLEVDDLVVFNHEGENSHFHVRIIGDDDFEMNYHKAGVEVTALALHSSDEQDDEAIVIESSSGSSGDEAKVIKVSSGSSGDEAEKIEARAKRVLPS